MEVKELQHLWGETLRSASHDTDQFDRLAHGVVDLYSSGNPHFRQHIKNRFKRVTERTGEQLDTENFDLAMARAFVADEIGFTSWADLAAYIENKRPDKLPILFRFAIAAMDMGNFTALEQTVGGPDAFDEQIVDWYEKGYFANEPETLAEVFAAACMLGHVRTAEYLLDKGVDPLAGIKTGLNGFHYAVSGGRLDVAKLLTARSVPMEVENMYGGTVLGQALWSAINEHSDDHAEIVKVLIEGGAHVWPDTLEWWEKQDVPSHETKELVAETLRKHADFHSRVDAAKQAVANAETDGSKRALADSLKALGNILRRPPLLRDVANEAYTRSAALYRELGLPLEEAWVKRHIGINHEYAGRLAEAEKYYDEALSLYREHSTDDLNYANAVRYPAVIKERLGKKDEAAQLWEEAHDRYREIGPDCLGEGVAEAAAWLTILAIGHGDSELAQKWFARASEASAASSDPNTHKFLAEVKARLDEESPIR